MKTLKVLLLTAVIVIVFSVGTSAFVPEDDSIDVGYSLIHSEPTSLNNTIDQNNEKYKQAENEGYEVKKIDNFNTISSYHITLLHQAVESDEDQESLMPSMDERISKENVRMGIGYEYLSGSVAGSITGTDNNDSNPRNRQESYKIGVHGLGLVGEYTSRSTLGLIVGYSAGYYYGNLEHTIKTEDGTVTENEKLYGLGAHIDIGGVLELDRVNFYGKVGYRRMFLQYDLDGLQYSAGATIRF